MTDTDEVELPVFAKGDLIKQPVKFHLDGSLTVNQQDVLERQITAHGGAICDDPKEADTVLAHGERYEWLTKRFAHSKTVWVELPTFVARCLHEKRYIHDRPFKSSLGGRPAGVRPRPFTIQDDYHLAEYLAIRIPDASAGGRTGNKVYEDLCKPMYSEDYPWASRHTWQSWRNRYRNRREWLDVMIEEKVKYDPPDPFGKGEYPHDRRLAGVSRHRARHQYINRSGQEDEETDEEGGESVNENHREQNERSASHRDKRRRIDTSNGESPSTPEQARQGRSHDTSKRDLNTVNSMPKDLLSDGNLIVFEANEDNGMGVYDEDWAPSQIAGPSNTQATLVNREPEREEATKSIPPTQVPSSSAISAERRMAARNRARSALAKPGATGRTVLTSSPLGDTQATVVATQRGAQALTRPTGRGAERAGLAEGRRSMHEIGKSGAENAVDDARPSESRATIAEPSIPASRRATGVIKEKNPTAAVAAPLSTNADDASRGRRQLNIERAIRHNATTSQGQRAAVDAPYRNTRARSRSVEPQVMPPPPVPDPGRRKRKVVMQAIEEQQEEEVDFHEADNVSDGVAYEEQQSLDVVEDALRVVQTQDEEEGHQGEGNEEEEEEGSWEEGEAEESEEEESQSSGDSEILERGLDIKKHLATPQQPLPEGRYDLPSTQSRFRSGPSRREASSESDFPTPGTRSRNAKEYQEALEKTVPFTPTPGTRAEVVRTVTQNLQTDITQRPRARKTIIR